MMRAAGGVGWGTGRDGGRGGSGCRRLYSEGSVFSGRGQVFGGDRAAQATQLQRLAFGSPGFGWALMLVGAKLQAPMSLGAVLPHWWRPLACQPPHRTCLYALTRHCTDM
jgi:hypothetical protein